MLKFSGIYINPYDVAAIFTSTDGKDSHPFYMTILLRNGKEYRVNYAREGARDAEALRLSKCVEQLQPVPVTLREIESVLGKAKDAIRRDIKALREEVMNEKGRGNNEQ